MRFDLYSLIHKGQRKYLYELAIDIGRCNASDEKECQHLAERVGKMVDHIREHAKNEETFIHPLFAEVGMQGTVLELEHHKTEEQMERLLELSSKKDMSALYKEFNSFVANYLLHTEEEERQQELVLWKHFDDKRLMSAFGAFAASKTPQEMLVSFEIMAPALNIHEVMKVFGARA